MSALPPEQAGVASGAQSTTRQLGGALGVAVLGSLLAARYTSTLSHTLPGTVAAPYLSTAKGSLATALQAAPGPGPARAVLTQLAQAAFVDGMHLAGTVTAGAAAVCALVVFVVLRPATLGAADAEISPAGRVVLAPTPEEP